MAQARARARKKARRNDTKRETTRRSQPSPIYADRNFFRVALTRVSCWHFHRRMGFWAPRDTGRQTYFLDPRMGGDSCVFPLWVLGSNGVGIPYEFLRPRQNFLVFSSILMGYTFG